MKKLILAAALVTAFSAQAEFKDGNDLLADMDAGSVYRSGVAMGYVVGVADGGMQIIHCPPAGVKAGQVYDMVRAHLVAFPATRHLTADVIVNYVLKESFPCPKKPTRGGAV